MNFDTIDFSGPFIAAYGFIRNLFLDLLEFLHSFKISGFSLLELWLAFSAAGILFTVLFSVVSSGVDLGKGMVSTKSKGKKKKSEKNDNKDNKEGEQ